MKVRHVLLAGIAAASFATAFAGVASAQAADPQADPAAAPAAPAADVPQDDIVVTAVARGTNRLNTSITTSSITSDALIQLAPRTSGELLRNLPGIRVEASGGDGNANISVRGLPVASGGSKFLQLQEDGLPILEFGDITFGNADIFLRADFNVRTVESVRGGSASTFASNSPGGVINFLSKTGEQEGGAFQLSSGLDYREFRVDFDQGGKLSDSLTYHFGGFYRIGDGQRQVGYDGVKGGQFKANITKSFGDGGYVRLYGKYLDDRAIGYLPNPVQVTGSDSDPTYRNITNFSINNGTLHSGNIRTVQTLDGDNKLVTRSIADGQHPVVYSAGLETQIPVADGWNVVERFRYSDISGGFTAPFPAAVGSAQSIANGIGGAGAQLFYASGSQAGQRIANPASLNGNGLLANVVLFDVDLKSLNNITNDIRLNGSVPVGTGSLSITGGFYASRQDIKSDWLWTSFVQTVADNGRSELVNVRTAAGVPVTQNGVTGYSASFFGNCCRRSYDLDYTTYAPFAQLGLEIGRFNIDGSLRYDFGRARGSVAGADLGAGFGTGITTFDINGDGVISAPERQVAVIPNVRSPLNYNYDYLSYSGGANYRLTDTTAVFARYSRGGRANADRLLFGPSINTRTGGLTDQGAAVDFVRQLEGGFKYRQNGLSLYATGFWARTEEQNFEATTQRFFNREYEAKGVELEGRIARGPFSLSAGGTYTDAEITKDVLNPAVEGNRPRRQAKFIFQATPQVDVGRLTVGANVIGTTDSFAQDNNGLKMPGYTQVNAFVSVRPADNVTLSVNGNNLFDVKGITEAEEGNIPSNGIVRARSITGRTISAAVRVGF
ncbi:outer membrane receptor protein involved in Fe transport [Sphingomonas aurantiaca]|uniref:Outer membrane receptor protein involved in Fe transport n=1 Tax=Sphingomonas aurantiaca TaxID=185949 RepID=A0A2T5GJ02_9SPHN|nr:TonB-dependent receptor [Sphingomonas aurantiaca]PTQ59293.1 outer membrane receptor protein involved in Fe transport [Sphingomonas aurantiaca]